MRVLLQRRPAHAADATCELACIREWGRASAGIVPQHELKKFGSSPGHRAASAGSGRSRRWSAATRSRPPRATPRRWTTWSPKYGDALLPIQLDVTDRAADFAAVKQAHDHFGRLDVVVNNAGYGHFGFIEELTEAEARDQIETNVFGALWVTQAALPFLRAQRSGHIIQVSSIGGITAFQNVGIYHASKWALEGFSQSLAQEVASFGIHVTLIEPGGFSTDWAGSSSKRVDAAARLRRGARGGRPDPQPARCPRRAIRQASARGHPQGRRRRTSRRCGCSSASCRCSWPRPTTRTGSRPGSSGSRSPIEAQG